MNFTSCFDLLLSISRLSSETWLESLYLERKIHSWPLQQGQTYSIKDKADSSDAFYRASPAGPENGFQYDNPNDISINGGNAVFPSKILLGTTTTI